MKVVDMGRACVMYGGEEKYVQCSGCWVGDTKQGDRLKTEVYVEDDNTKMDLKEMEWRAWTLFVWFKNGQVVGLCEHCNASAVP
jgi:hypothetical protein